jgi:hypothetical protein
LQIAKFNAPFFRKSADLGGRIQNFVKNFDGISIANCYGRRNGDKNQGDRTQELVSIPELKLMSTRQIENSGDMMFCTPVKSGPVAKEIPIQFTEGSPCCFPIKIQPPNIMSQLSNNASEKPLIPALFQIAACADNIRSISALKNALSMNRIPIADMMLDPDKIEAMLKSISRRKKISSRQIPTDRFSKETV